MEHVISERTLKKLSRSARIYEISSTFPKIRIRIPFFFPNIVKTNGRKIVDYLQLYWTDLKLHINLSFFILEIT